MVNNKRINRGSGQLNNGEYLDIFDPTSLYIRNRPPLSIQNKNQTWLKYFLIYFFGYFICDIGVFLFDIN